MRWYIIRTLLHKELLRQASNRGGIALAALLVVAALLLAFFNRPGQAVGAMPDGIQMCYIDYWEEDAWVAHLRAHVPADLESSIEFRHVSQAPKSGGLLVYSPLTGAIQIRNAPRSDGKSKKIWIWYPDRDGAALKPYELWFWRESALYFQNQARGKDEGETLADRAPEAPPQTAEFETDRMHLKGAFDMGTSVTASLVLFALFFSCVYLLPSLMCEERERGVLLAQALSPASPTEILAAKFLFYPTAGMVLAALLAGIFRPGALLHPFLWLALLVIAVGSLGIGLTIASLARSQRTASMAALCYMLVVALFLYLCQQCDIMELSYLALEYHGPRMLHAALADAVLWQHWGHLAAAAALAVAWCGLATFLFRRRGWQ
jgi:hypothetical protein